MCLLCDSCAAAAHDARGPHTCLTTKSPPLTIRGRDERVQEAVARENSLKFASPAENGRPRRRRHPSSCSEAETIAEGDQMPPDASKRTATLREGCRHRFYRHFTRKPLSFPVQTFTPSSHAFDTTPHGVQHAAWTKELSVNFVCQSDA
jgi:hypothetical protein